MPLRQSAARASTAAGDAARRVSDWFTLVMAWIGFFLALGAIAGAFYVTAKPYLPGDYWALAVAIGLGGLVMWMATLSLARIRR